MGPFRQNPVSHQGHSDSKSGTQPSFLKICRLHWYRSIVAQHIPKNAAGLALCLAAETIYDTAGHLPKAKLYHFVNAQFQLFLIREGHILCRSSRPSPPKAAAPELGRSTKCCLTRERQIIKTILKTQKHLEKAHRGRV